MLRFLLLLLYFCGELSLAQSQSALQVVRSTVTRAAEAAQANAEFDETPIRNLAAEVKAQIQEQMRAEIAEAQALAGADAVSGQFSAIQAEVGASSAEERLERRRETVACTNLDIDRVLIDALTSRCNIRAVSVACDLAKSHMSTLLAEATDKAKIANPQRVRASPSFLSQLVAVQNNLLRALEASDAQVIACYNGLETLASPTCLNTYRDVLTENLNLTVKTCLPETVDVQIDRFVVAVRSYRLSDILSTAVNDYAQARETQIQAGRLLVEITQAGEALLSQINVTQRAFRSNASAIPPPAPRAN